MTIPQQPAKRPDKATYPDLLAEIKRLTATLQTLREQAIETLAPAVQEMVHSGSRDVQRIEHTLDQLLSVVDCQEGLALFKTLCRHYETLDPQATAAYVHAYREWWDDNEQNDTSEA
ncbi:MAG: hypothetical protein RJA34_77 [Pseudomonadota bacterium]|jgi:hypothetical protein